MGRRKILINQITDPKLRNITFIKRRHGLIKKAAELSLLCNVNMLLIFEDGNGNLIQFSRNKITTIPSFFKECTYSSVSEFTSNDYPNFFNGSHKRKRRGRKNGEESNKEAVTAEEDGFPALEDLPLLVPEVQSSQKGENITTAPASIYEGFMSPGMVSYSSSEEPSSEGRDEIHPSSDNQVRESYYNQSRPSRYMMNKPEDMGGHYPKESGICLNKRDAEQNHHKGMPISMRCPIIEDKPSDYIQPHIPSKRPVKRLSFREDRSHPYRNYPFEYNMPNYPDYHPSHYQYSYYYDPYPHRSLHFSHYTRPGAQTFREMSDEEAVDKMFRFPPKGLGMGPGDHKSERNEFTHISGNYVKNREKVANYVNPDYQQEVYHYQKGDYYSYGDNISSSLDYANSFESDSFNEFSDPKKKLKQ